MRCNLQFPVTIITAYWTLVSWTIIQYLCYTCYLCVLQVVNPNAYCHKFTSCRAFTLHAQHSYYFLVKPLSSSTMKFNAFCTVFCCFYGLWWSGKERFRHAFWCLLVALWLSLHSNWRNALTGFYETLYWGISLKSVNTFQFWYSRQK
jgi:hypothetical protein